MKFKLVTLGVLPLLLFATVVQADADSRSVRFNGFGTLGVVHSSEDQADFRNNVLQPGGAGHSHDWSVGVDSRIGLQASAEFGDRLSGVVQVLSEQQYDDTFSPFVEWANLKYELTPELSIRAGRTVLPTFLASDFRKVGFANPWVRPPTEVYTLVPVTSNDGIDAIYQTRSGSMVSTFQAYYGGTRFKVPERWPFEADDSYGFSGTFEIGNLTMRGGYSRSTLISSGPDPLFDAFRSFGPAGAAIADRYDLDRKPIDIFTVGGNYDPGDWFVQAEWASGNSRTFIGDNRGWYVGGGYRLGKFTPYASYGQNRRQGDTTNTGLDTTTLPAPAQAPAAALNAQLEVLIRANEFDTLTLGTRWDFSSNAALKMQVDRIFLADGSQGTLTNVQPGFERGSDVTLFSIALDFVF